MYVFENVRLHSWPLRFHIEVGIGQVDNLLSLIQLSNLLLPSTVGRLNYRNLTYIDSPQKAFSLLSHTTVFPTWYLSQKFG